MKLEDLTDKDMEIIICLEDMITAIAQSLAINYGSQMIGSLDVKTMYGVCIKVLLRASDMIRKEIEDDSIGPKMCMTLMANSDLKTIADFKIEDLNNINLH